MTIQSLVDGCDEPIGFIVDNKIVISKSHQDGDFFGSYIFLTLSNLIVDDQQKYYIISPIAPSYAAVHSTIIECLHKNGIECRQYGCNYVIIEPETIFYLELKYNES
jgi:hypothetical protein